MTIPVFNNKENELVELKDGRKVHLSRSMTLCIPVTAITEAGELYTLVSKRGMGVPNFQGYWNLICGYLDYDEDLNEAAKREIWEESGLNVDAINKKDIIYSIENLPWFIQSKPKDSKQNVTIRQGLFFKVKAKEDLPKLSNKYAEKNEVIESKWLLSSECLKIKCNKEEKNKNKEMIWAFNHYEIYREWINKITN